MNFLENLEKIPRKRLLYEKSPEVFIWFRDFKNSLRDFLGANLPHPNPPHGDFVERSVFYSVAQLVHKRYIVAEAADMVSKRMSLESNKSLLNNIKDKRKESLLFVVWYESKRDEREIIIEILNPFFLIDNRPDIAKSKKATTHSSKKKADQQAGEHFQHERAPIPAGSDIRMVRRRLRSKI